MSESGGLVMENQSQFDSRDSSSKRNIKKKIKIIINKIIIIINNIIKKLFINKG